MPRVALLIPVRPLVITLAVIFILVLVVILVLIIEASGA